MIGIYDSSSFPAAAELIFMMGMRQSAGETTEWE